MILTLIEYLSKSQFQKIVEEKYLFFFSNNFRKQKN